VEERVVNEPWLQRLNELGRLEGEEVVLEPLVDEHSEPLCRFGLDEELWRWTVSVVRSPEEMAAYVGAALKARAEGEAFPYVIRTRAGGLVVGCTRYGNIDMANRRVEIGWTWVGREHQRSAVNTEAKYLLLRTAFEELGCSRVEFKTDALNERSRAALVRIGAKEEGVLRQHMITASGRLRDTVYYGVLDSEWPGVRQVLRGKLGRIGNDRP